MWYFEILFCDTGDTKIILGYSLKDACRKAGIKEDENIRVLISEFED